MQEQHDKLRAAIDSGDLVSIRAIADGDSGVVTSYPLYDKRKETPLHRAVNVRRSHQVDVAGYFLQHPLAGYMADTKDFRGETPLHRCAWVGLAKTAEILLQLGVDIDVGNQLGLVPLHLAVERGHADVLELLLAHKANVNLKTNRGNSALHRAVETGRKDLMIPLIKANANPDSVNLQKNRAGGKYSSRELFNMAGMEDEYQIYNWLSHTGIPTREFEVLGEISSGKISDLTAAFQEGLVPMGLSDNLVWPKMQTTLQEIHGVVEQQLKRKNELIALMDESKNRMQELKKDMKEYNREMTGIRGVTDEWDRLEEICKTRAQKIPTLIDIEAQLAEQVEKQIIVDPEELAPLTEDSNKPKLATILNAVGLSSGFINQIRHFDGYEFMARSARYNRPIQELADIEYCRQMMSNKCIPYSKHVHCKHVIGVNEDSPLLI